MVFIILKKKNLFKWVKMQGVFLSTKTAQMFIDKYYV